MSSSPARLEANRRIVRSIESKTRADALPHGLTGEGVEMTVEEITEVERRAQAFAADLNPQGELARCLVRRAALHSVRLDQCARHQTAVVRHAVRHAVSNHDESRAVEVAALKDRLAENPETVSRLLRRTREGLVWLIERWEGLQTMLLSTQPGQWHVSRIDECDRLQGRRFDAYGVSRVSALGHAVLGAFQHLRTDDDAGLDPEAKKAWARHQLDQIMETELQGLRQALDAIDPEEEARDRAEAADRALFDPSPKATLARRYEAAAERGLYRALREIKELAATQNETVSQVEPEGKPDGQAEPEPVPPEPLGSFGHRPEPIPVPIAAAPANPRWNRSRRRSERETVRPGAVSARA